MNDDFNTSVVMAHLNEGLRYLNSSTKDNDFVITAQAWVNAAKILGLLSLTPKQFDEELFSIKNQNRSVCKLGWAKGRLQSGRKRCECNFARRKQERP